MKDAATAKAKLSACCVNRGKWWKNSELARLILASLKQSPKWGAVPEASLNPVAPAETQSGAVFFSRNENSPRAENRSTPRYRCQGSAHLCEINGRMATWATITDISLRGCYVEIPTCFRVGAALAIIIEVNGMRVEATGEVRVAYPGLGMGISFSEISIADQESLRALISSLSGTSRILGSTPSLATGMQNQPHVAGEMSNPDAALQAVVRFFDERHVMGREEFFKILRKT
jgi:PilZ domain